MNSNSHLRPGTLLRNDTYRIERALGQGGFGITYLAVHTRLNKRVAIKEFFPKTFCDRAADTNMVRTASQANSMTVEKLRNKFIKEAQHIAEMDSPYIVRIVDVFEENHTAYYIMDYIEGISLSDLVKSSGPLPEKQAVEFVCKVGEALSYIHAKKMNHLDVKPANIMLRAKDNAPVLIDFGLSKQYDSDGHQTTSNPVGYSHGYAPMEQYRDGGVREFSPSTDVYSLAATLYYLVSGTVPPQAPKLVEEDLTFPPKFPQRLIPVISTAMSTKRSERQATVALFCEQLRAAESLDDEKTHYKVPADDEKTQHKSKPESKASNSGSPVPPPPPVPPKPAPKVKKTDDGVKKTVDHAKRKRLKKLLLIGGGAALVISLLIVFFTQTYPEYKRVTAVEDEIEADTVVVIEEVPATAPAVSGAPLSEGEIVDGRGGFADNAEGYFSQYADQYLTANRDVYFDGYFSDDKGRYPIMLKFEIDDNWYPGVCYYHNINYATKLKMSVRFTEEQMIITGNAGGDTFTMKFSRSSNGRWRGTAQNGNHTLEARIWPVKR